jgi:hypothetical protein
VPARAYGRDRFLIEREALAGHASLRNVGPSCAFKNVIHEAVMTEQEIIESKSALLADLRRGNPDGIPVTPKNIFAAGVLVKNDQAEVFRDGWGYLRIRAVRSGAGATLR